MNRYIFSRRTCFQCYGEGKALGPNGEKKTCPTCGGKGYVEE